MSLGHLTNWQSLDLLLSLAENEKVINLMTGFIDIQGGKHPLCPLPSLLLPMHGLARRRAKESLYLLPPKETRPQKEKA